MPDAHGQATTIPCLENQMSSAEKHELTQLADSMRELSQSIGAQGIGVTQQISLAAEKIDRAADRLSDAINRSAAASEKHARGLVFAIWALVAATVVLVFVTYLIYLNESEQDSDQSAPEASLSTAPPRPAMKGVSWSY